MKPRALLQFAAISAVIPGFAGWSQAQQVNGVEHWVEREGVKLYVWEKYAGSPAGKGLIVLAHGSATAGKESFDLQGPGKPAFSLVGFLPREGFDGFPLDTRGFRRPTHPHRHQTD